MLLSHSVFSIFEVLLVILPVLIGVAFVTVAERKTMASMQRRLGPNIVGQLKNLYFKKSLAKHGNHSVFSINKYVIKGRGGRVSIIRRFSSSLSSAAFTSQPFSCNPDWITGFVDAEGSFGVQIVKSPLYRLGWTVEPSFSISLHEKDREVLEIIKNYWGV